MCDEAGSFYADSSIRSPPGSARAPPSEAGSVIFVKLRGFDPAGQKRVLVDAHIASWLPGMMPSLSVMPLHQFGTEHAALAP
jgi:hypothetical protein